MRLGLGIDTGSTYTDCVALDFDTQKVIAKAKAPTTHHDLSIGLINSMNKVLEQGIDPKDVRLLSLSTTLATNAIVENKGGEVALIVIGFTPYGDWKLPIKRVFYTEGGESATRAEEIPPDFDAIRAYVEATAPEVDAFAVSGFMSVRSNVFEKQTAEIIRQSTGLPVVCGSDLSSKLGLYERSVTAVLNARLISLTDDLIQEMKKVMGEKGMRAPLKIVRGDGSLLSEAMALERPIETLQSGPAASAIGGAFLAGKRDSIVIDIGGTTTDIALLQEGIPSVTEEGSLVGGWRTRVRSVDTVSEGLGCESNIEVYGGTDVVIGPRRVVPLAKAVREYPSLLDKIRETRRIHYFTTYQASRKTVKADVNTLRILDTLSRIQPASYDELKYAVDELTRVHLDEGLQKLEAGNAVMRIGFTPLDILHIQGRRIVGDPEGSRLGGQILADQMGVSLEEFCDLTCDLITKRIGAAVLKKLIADWSHKENLGEHSLPLLYKSMEKEKSYFSCTLRPRYPILGVGGPAQVFLPDLKKVLGTEVIVPEYFEVGNAVGAISGRISWTVEKEVVRKELEHRYYVYPDGCYFSREKEAVQYAISQATGEARKEAIRAGAEDPQIHVERRDRIVMLITGQKGFGSALIRVTAVGEVSLKR
jgi:N-methylhydantoinase A/oxoprolinase/acetone carboxylase beta subunit